MRGIIEMAKKVRQQPGIQSVEVAARILRALIDGGRPLPLKDLARLARMHPGKVHRYLVSLARTELVSQDDSSGHYGVGPMAIALGLSGLRNVNVVRASTALLPSLRDEINETVLLAIWSPQGPVVFALEESSRPVSMNIRVGSILPILSTASGRVFAAFMPGELTAPLVEVEQRRAPRFRDPKIVEEARQRGFAAVKDTCARRQRRFSSGVRPQQQDRRRYRRAGTNRRDRHRRGGKSHEGVVTGRRRNLVAHGPVGHGKRRRSPGRSSTIARMTVRPLLAAAT